MESCNRVFPCEKAFQIEQFFGSFGQNYLWRTPLQTIMRILFFLCRKTHNNVRYEVFTLKVQTMSFQTGLVDTNAHLNKKKKEKKEEVKVR